MSRGQVVGSMPTGTFWNVASPPMGGVTLAKNSLNVWVMVGATHDTCHFTIHILLKRVRTELTMLAARASCLSRTTLKKPPISGLAKPSMNSRALALNSSTTLLGSQIEITGTGVLGGTSLFSGKRPLVRYSRSRFEAAAVELGSAPAAPFESTTSAWCIGTGTEFPALPS